MNEKQKVAIVAPVILTAVMVPVFRFLAGQFAYPISWYLGMLIYWLVWCGPISWWIIGRERIKDLIRPQKPTAKILAFVAFPLVMSALYKLVPSSGYAHDNIWILLLWLSSTFMNGFFEELLWRGVYMTLFPNNNWIRILWASIWFSLWHYAPGSISPDGKALSLMVGASFFGFYLSFLAKKTGTIWWGMIAHTLGGIIMIL